jgi:hypothetical protein
VAVSRFRGLRALLVFTDIGGGSYRSLTIWLDAVKKTSSEL